MAGKNASQKLERAKQKTLQATAELAAAEQVQKDHEQTRNETVKAAEASPTQITAAAFSDDNTYLALGDTEHRIQLLDASTGSLFLTLDDQPGPIHTVHFAQDTSLVALASDGKLVVWPSYLYHGSHPYSGEENRIIVSANATVSIEK